jgi:hypothetical protein
MQTASIANSLVASVKLHHVQTQVSTNGKHALMQYHPVQMVRCQDHTDFWYRATPTNFLQPLDFESEFISSVLDLFAHVICCLGSRASIMDVVERTWGPVASGTGGKLVSFVPVQVRLDMTVLPPGLLREEGAYGCDMLHLQTL